MTRGLTSGIVSITTESRKAEAAASHPAAATGEPWFQDQDLGRLAGEMTEEYVGEQQRFPCCSFSYQEVIASLSCA